MLENRCGRTYHYRSERDGDRVRRTYTGADELARIADELDRIEREEREAERLAEAARLEDLREEVGESAGRIGEAARMAGKVVAARMGRLGVRKVGSRWRRERGEAMNQIAAVKPNTRDLAAIERKVSGTMMGRLGMALRWLPKGPGSDEVREVMTREAIAFARELAGERPSPAEWELSLLAALIGQEMIRWEAEVDTLSGLKSPRRFDAASRHLNRLRRQQAATLRDLAIVRKHQMAVLVQVGTVNIAGQQVVNNAPAPEPGPAIEAGAGPARAGRRSMGGRRG